MYVYVYIYTVHQDFSNKIRLELCEMGFVLKQVTRSSNQSTGVCNILHYLVSQTLCAKGLNIERSKKVASANCQ